MAIQGVHLTRIGRGNFLLEPLRSLDIRQQHRLVEEVIAHMQQGQGKCLYYDLHTLPVIDHAYYDWLDTLARACQTVNIAMVCINMQPTAAYALSGLLTRKPVFETALSVPD